MASFVLVTALLVAITAALCYRYRTKANPSIAARLIALLWFGSIAWWFLPNAYDAIAAGQVDCVGRRCHGQVYLRSQRPADFWVTTGLWYLGGVLCASFCVFALIPPGSREGDR